MKLKVVVYRISNQSKERTSCKLHLYELKDHSGLTVDSHKVVVYCGGEYEFELEPGEYGIECYKGPLYTPVEKKVRVGGEDTAMEIGLEQLIDTRSLGLYSFDAHSHVSRNLQSTSGNLKNASIIMKGEDFDFFFAGSPYDLETHLLDQNGQQPQTEQSYREHFSAILEEVNDGSFILDIGNEIVKCRYGHLFMMNYNQLPPFSKYYDRSWDPWLFTKVGPEPAYEIAYPYEALAKERGENSVAVAAHPTSWWYHNGEFITNIAASLGFDILAGAVDAMVIMGYDSDRLPYQRLWYDALNNGYFLPGVAESDHTFDSTRRKHLKFKTYTYADEFSIDALCTAVKAGRNMVSSGPILQLKVNGQLPGTVFSYKENENFRIQVETFRCYQASLSKIQLIVNGEIWKEVAVNANQYELEDQITINQDSYILAKCYDSAGNAAITNPVYIRNTPFANRDFKCELRVNVTKDGHPATGSFWLDETGDKTAFSGDIHCRIHPAAAVNVEVGGTVKTIKLFEMDELQRIFRHLYFGYFNQDNRYATGDVPAACFELARIRELLSRAELQLSF